MEEPPVAAPAPRRAAAAPRVFLMAGDRANGLRTVPVVLGRACTLRLLHAANAALAAAAIAGPLLGWARRYEGNLTTASPRI